MPQEFNYWLTTVKMPASAVRALASSADVAIIGAGFTGLSAALALAKGTGGWSRGDLCCLVGAGVGLVAWGLSGTPEAALGASLAVDFCGAVPTVQNVARDPSSESAAPTIKRCPPGETYGCFDTGPTGKPICGCE